MRPDYRFMNAGRGKSGAARHPAHGFGSACRARAYTQYASLAFFAV